MTVKCPEATLEEKCSVNGREYTVVSEEKLGQMVADGLEVVFVCTSQVKPWPPASSLYLYKIKTYN